MRILMARRGSVCLLYYLLKLRIVLSQYTDMKCQNNIMSVVVYLCRNISSNWISISQFKITNKFSIKMIYVGYVKCKVTLLNVEESSITIRGTKERKVHEETRWEKGSWGNKVRERYSKCIITVIVRWVKVERKWKARSLVG